VVKICRECQETYSGGHTCHECGGPLLDVAERDVRARYLEDPEVAYSIRFLYQCRRGMVLMFLGVLLGLAVTVACIQRGVLTEGGASFLWYGLAVLTGVGFPLLGLYLGSVVVRSTRQAV
jgi:hypothetical protein